MFRSKKIGEIFQLTHYILRGINATVWGCAVAGVSTTNEAVKNK